jgi:hypothetical protein
LFSVGKFSSHIYFFCQHLQDEDSDLTYVGCSFEAILNQTMHQLGYDRKYVHKCPTLIMEGFQAKLHVTMRGPDPPTSPSLIVVSRPCRRSCEARESALLNALLHINDECAYRISDLHFTDLIMRERQIAYSF